MPYSTKKTPKGWKVLVRGKALPGVSKTKNMAKKRIKAIGARTHGK